MELYHSHHFDWIRAKFSQALSWLQGRNSKSSCPPETLKLLRAVGLLMAACILAWISVAATREMTIVEYRERYRPHGFLWRALLHAKGYSPATTHEKENLMSSQKEFSENPVRIQISPGLETMIFPRGALSETLEIWHRDALDPKYADWVDLPNDLSGLEKLQTLLEKSLARPQKRTSNQAKSIDPKEIRY